jgi:uncharacterized protein YndB with AHSA1/START domain
MRTIDTEIEIAAPPRTVWEDLIDPDAYSEWNPQTTSASGTVREGEAVGITVESHGRRPASMRPRVVDANPERRPAWVAIVVYPRCSRRATPSS